MSFTEATDPNLDPADDGQSLLLKERKYSTKSIAAPTRMRNSPTLTLSWLELEAIAPLSSTRAEINSLTCWLFTLSPTFEIRRPDPSPRFPIQRHMCRYAWIEALLNYPLGGSMMPIWR